MKKNLFITCVLVFTNKAFSRTITAVASSGWGVTATTWSPAVVPTCGDTVVIPAGITVTVDGNYDLASGACSSKPSCLIISGTLYFTNHNALNLAVGSAFYIENGGTVSSQNNGSNTYITIGGTTEWTGGNQSSTTGVSGTVSISGGGIVVTPIELLNFAAKPNGNKVAINWQTITETNNQYFTIERSADGTHFSELTRLNSAAPNGNSTSLLSYEYFDENPFSGASYYRLKQTDYNGKFAYFTMVSVDFLKSKNITFTVYPNPNMGEFTVNFAGIENNHEVQIILSDAFGKEVYSTSLYTASMETTRVSLTPDTKLAKANIFVPCWLRV
jgi:hypothetical protein